MWGSQRLAASTSAKLDSVTAGGSALSRTRTSHTAIVQRFISSPGQNMFSAHSVPSNTPRALSASMAGLCTPPVTSANPPAVSPPSSWAPATGANPTTANAATRAATTTRITARHYPAAIPRALGQLAAATGSTGSMPSSS